MELVIRAKNFTLDSQLKDYITKKFLGAEKFVSMCQSSQEWENVKASCELFISIEKHSEHHRKGMIFKGSAKAKLPHVTVEAEVNAATVKEAVDGLKEEFLNEVKKYKSKTIDKKRKQERRFKDEVHTID